MTSSASTAGCSALTCLSVPNFKTVPANRLKCTVALVAIAPSAKPQTSCAAKMLSGLERKSSIETRPERQTARRRRKASSRSSGRDMSYFLWCRGGEGGWEGREEEELVGRGEREREKRSRT